MSDENRQTENAAKRSTVSWEAQIESFSVEFQQLGVSESPDRSITLELANADPIELHTVSPDPNAPHIPLVRASFSFTDRTPRDDRLHRLKFDKYDYVELRATLPLSDFADMLRILETRQCCELDVRANAAAGTQIELETIESASDVHWTLKLSKVSVSTRSPGAALGRVL